MAEYDPGRAGEPEPSFEVTGISSEEVALGLYQDLPARGEARQSEEPEEHRTPRVPQGEEIPDTFQTTELAAPQERAAANEIRILRNRSVRHNTGQYSHVLEPSVARKGKYVFYTGNWFAALSTDGGNTWSYVDPYEAFDPQPGEPGFCCDQVVVYAPQIDMFIWSLQSRNFAVQRILYARPEDAARGRWRRFSLTPANLGVPGGELDYVDMAVGANMLYWTTNVFNTEHIHAVAVRVPLDSLRRGSPAPAAWHSPHFTLRLAQGCDTIGYFASHNTTSNLRIYAWAENAGSPVAHNVNVPSWQYGNSGVTWLEFDDSRPVGGAKLGDEVWFSWNVNARAGRPYPFAQIVRIRTTGTFATVGSADVWRQDAAVGYAALAPNSVTREVGASYAFGVNAPSHAVGVLTGTPAHQVTLQGRPTGVNRWGDYLTIRQDYDDSGAALPSFAAAGYALNQSGASQPRFIQFERAGQPRGGDTDPTPGEGSKVDSFGDTAERLLASVLGALQTNPAQEEASPLAEVGLIEFHLEGVGFSLKVKIASKECCRGS